jgi:hypothetical protein
MILDSPFISGSMSFGIANPSATMHISASTGAVLRVDGAGVTNTGSLFVSSSGNVGIGTTIPVSKLQVEGGALRIGDGAGSWSGFTFSGGLRQTNNNPLTILGELRVDSTAGNPSYISGSGGLAVGKTTANTRLDVNGNTLISGSINATGPITGSSFTTTGTITAQTLVVQTVSSSVSYISGSTQFGSSSINTHQFTGSMFVTGALYVTTGSVGIGTLSPTSLLEVQANQNAQTGIRVRNSTSGTGAQVEFGVYTNSGNGGFGKYSTGATPYKNIAAASTYVYNGTSGDIALLNDAASGNISFAAGAASTAQMFISASGFVGIGVTNPPARLSIQGTSPGSYNSTSFGPTATMNIRSNEFTNDAWNSVLNIALIRQSLTTGASSYGGIGFTTIDDSNAAEITDAARIAITNDNPSSTTSATAMSFWTNTGGSPSNVALERMRIRSDGSVAIGISSSTAPFAVYVNGNHPSLPTVQFVSSASNGSQVFTTIGGSDSWHGISLRGVPSTAADWSITPGNQISFFEYGGDFRFYEKRPASLTLQVQLLSGTIYALSTSISSLSDIRLKENIRTIGYGLNEIIQLQPKIFDWKEGQGTGAKNNLGFIAQDVETILPELVTEWSHTEGETAYKSLKMGDIIPVLVKAIQELKAEIDELKNK